MLSTLLKSKAESFMCKLESCVSYIGLVCGVLGLILFCFISFDYVELILTQEANAATKGMLLLAPLSTLLLIWQWKKRNVLYKNLRLRSELSKRNTAF